MKPQSIKLDLQLSEETRAGLEKLRDLETRENSVITPEALDRAFQALRAPLSACFVEISAHFAAIQEAMAGAELERLFEECEINTVFVAERDRKAEARARSRKDVQTKRRELRQRKGRL